MTKNKELKLNSAILSLALPAIFSNITVPILGLSDTYISGHLGADKFVAAIAVGSMMMNSCFWLFGFLRAGTTGLTAEAYGRKDILQSRRIFTLAFLIAVIIGALLVIFSYPLSRLMLLLMSPSPSTSALASEYFIICIFGAPALLATMTVVGWMIGMQNTLYPMIVSVSINILNIALSFIFVFGLETGFKGVAFGTLCANWIGLVLAIILARKLLKNHSEKGVRYSIWSPLRNLLTEVDAKRFFRVNSDLMMRSFCILSVTFGMTSFGGRMGDETLAVNSIIMQLFLFFSYFSDGFAFSAEALCGRFAGEKNWVDFERVIRRLWVWCGCIAGCFTLIYFFGIKEISLFLTESEDIMMHAVKLNWVIGLIPLLSVGAFLYDGIYIGLTSTRMMLLITFIGTSFFFGSYLTSQLLEINAVAELNKILWIGFLGFLAIRGVGLFLYSPSAVKKYKITYG